jgi:hypothetical protein
MSSPNRTSLPVMRVIKIRFPSFFVRAALSETFNRDANGVRENNGSLPHPRTPLA